MNQTDVSVPTPELTDAYFALAKSSLDNMIALTQQAVEENPEFAAKVQMPVSAMVIVWGKGKQIAD